MDVQEEEDISAIEDEEVEVDINDDVNMPWACFNPFFAYVKEKMLRISLHGAVCVMRRNPAM